MSTSKEETITTTFDGLDDRLVDQLVEMGFKAPTPIQVAAMPPLLAGRDIIGRARTGSGKTAAFALPMLELVKEGGGHVRALVLCPTRELAIQVGDAIREHATKLSKVRGVTIYGGSPYPPQIRALRSGCSIVVGTPGRVIDLMERGSLDLSNLELFVLDEADEMLRMGFIEDIERLLAETPSERQVALFSASMPPPIRKVAGRYLRDPVEIQVEGKALTVDHITQCWLVVPGNRKLEALIRILQGTERGPTLVFARTRASCNEVAEQLARRGYGADALHGDLSQAARERVLNRLRSGDLSLLIATDVAARGLDVRGLTHVINLDLPENKEIYVHRIGRTGRAGAKGTAISLATPGQQRFMRQIEQSLRVQIEQVQVPSDAQIARLQRGTLSERLADSKSEGVAGQEWLAELMEERGWTVEETAARALELIARRSGVSLAAAKDMDESPPHWSRGGGGGGRASKPRHRADPIEFDGGRDESNEVQLVVHVGRNQGTRPADLVGAIANEAGIPGRAIGQIQITETASFVGLPKRVAEAMLKRHGKISVRGIEASIDMSSTAPKAGGRPPAPKPRDTDRGDAAPRKATPTPTRSDDERPHHRPGPKAAKATGKKPHRKGRFPFDSDIDAPRKRRGATATAAEESKPGTKKTKKLTGLGVKKKGAKPGFPARKGLKVSPGTKKFGKGTKARKNKPLPSK